MTGAPANSYLELWEPSGPRPVSLNESPVTLGKTPEAAIIVNDDPTVSRVHAVLELYSGGWGIRDLGSSNGTYVNGQRLLGERLLRDRDEIKVGRTRIVYRGETSDQEQTVRAEDAPDLTARERDILTALCRPVLSGDIFSEPASTKQIAEELVISEAAVKQHISRLYDKFGISTDMDRRRARLANDAVKRGAISLGNLRPNP